MCASNASMHNLRATSYTWKCHVCCPIAHYAVADSGATKVEIRITRCVVLLWCAQKLSRHAGFTFLPHALRCHRCGCWAFTSAKHGGRKFETRVRNVANHCVNGTILCLLIGNYCNQQVRKP